MITISEQELEKVLAEVESDLASLFKSDREGKLAKSDDEESPDDAPAGPPADVPPPDAAPAPAPDEGAPAPEADAPMGDAPQDPAANPAADPAAGNAPMDVDSLKAEYAQLAPEELKMHYLAAKAALFQTMGDQGGGDAAPTPPPPGQDAAPAPAPAPAMKSEKDTGESMKKTEEQFSELNQKIELLSKALELSLGQPQRKAITGVDYLRKSDAETKPQLSRDEIKSKLLTVAADSSLKKSDRTLINQFCVGEADVSDIEHLLK